MNRFVQVLLALSLLAAGSDALSAQRPAGRSVVSAGPKLRSLPTEDPRVRRAGEFLETLFRGDFAAAEAYLAQHAAPDYGTGEGMVPATQVAEQFAGYTLEMYDEVERGDTLTVYMRKGQDVRGVMIRVEREAPHRILGILNARIRYLDAPPADGRRP
ncbi:MAG: hypothetical protein AB1941_04880 [Gemmatimonadota bacterium]